MAVNMESSMWHVSAIPWKAEYGPKVKMLVPLTRTSIRNVGGSTQVLFVPEIMHGRGHLRSSPVKLERRDMTYTVSMWRKTQKKQTNLTRKQWAEPTKMEFWKGIWGYETCISQLWRQ
jgi:hypothetical protein